MTMTMTMILGVLLVVGVGIGMGILIWGSLGVGEGNNNKDKKDEGGIWGSELQGKIDMVDKMGKDLGEMVRMMKEDREREIYMEKEKELKDVGIRYKKDHRTPNPVLSSNMVGDKPVSTKANIAIPFNLSQMDKDILDEFYNK